jgi:hypothetical protein
MVEPLDFKQLNHFLSLWEVGFLLIETRVFVTGTAWNSPRENLSVGRREPGQDAQRRMRQPF